MKYVYPALVSKIDEGEFKYHICFVDFGMSTDGTSLDDAMMMADDLLKTIIETYQILGDKLPKPSEIDNIKKENASDMVKMIEVEV